MSRELVLEATRRMLGLESVRVEGTLSMEDGRSGEQGVQNYAMTAVGDDYHQTGIIDGGEVAHHVRAILGEPTESLHLRGIDYVRDPRHGDWLKLRPDDRGHAMTHTISVSDSAVASPALFSEEEYRRIHLLLGGDPGQIETYEAVGTKPVSGKHLVHVSGQFARTIDREQINIEDFKRATIIEPESLAKLEELLGSEPNVHRQTLELWIDEATCLIHRLEWVYEGFRDGRLTYRRQDSRLNTLFNEAALLEPLPD